MADTAKYRLIGTNHGDAETGDVVELTESQYEAFSDKFEPVSESDESDSFDSEDGEQKYPVHKGAGYYELSNGESVRGKEDAINAQNELDSE